MRGHLLVLVCVWAAASALAASSSSSSSLDWRRFKSEHQKVYGPEEDAMRFANFLATKQMIERHNANPNATFKMGLNHMADWTHEEREQITGTKLSGTEGLARGRSLSPELEKLLDGPVPKEVDWRKVPNRVSAVKEQGNCNSDWAFVTTGLIEGQQAVANMSELIPLSVQLLIDCTIGDSQCVRGYVIPILRNIVFTIIGLESEADYPYEGKKGKCRSDITKTVMTISGFTLLERDEELLMKTVANYGPVAAIIMATDNFLHYSSGVLDDPLCIDPISHDNHAVLVVGYGTNAKEGDYWIVKNSWGTKWGEEGYIRMKRGVDMCAISSYAATVIL